MCSYPDGVSITFLAHMSHSALIVLIHDHNILPALYCVCFLLETQDNGRTMYYSAIEYGQSTSTVHELTTRDLCVCELLMTAIRVKGYGGHSAWLRLLFHDANFTNLVYSPSQSYLTFSLSTTHDLIIVQTVPLIVLVDLFRKWI